RRDRAGHRNPADRAARIAPTRHDAPHAVERGVPHPQHATQPRALLGHLAERAPAIAVTLEELLAREEIGDVVKRLARGTDRLDAEMIESCYHDDGFDDHNAFRGSPSEFAKWVLEVLDTFDCTMHFTGSPYIRLDGD